MSKADKDGWIRHNSKQQPVDDHVEVEIRTRGGEYEICEASGFAWNATEENQIMAYRLHKPAEQVEACSKPDPRNSAKRDSDYVCWMRDRITEIDATTQALTTERADLVQKLASEGFALIGRVVEPVEDYGNIQIGDLVSVISIGGFSDCTGLSVGDIVEVTSVDNDGSLKTVSGGSWGSIGYNYKFHSRPSA